MPPDTLAQSAAPTDNHSVLPAEWRRPLGVLVFGWAFLLAAFWHDWSGMADQWWNASTYNHIVFVPLIIGWLVAQRWSELRRVTVSGWWPGIVLFAGAAFIWLAGALAEVNLLRHAAGRTEWPSVGAADWASVSGGIATLFGARSEAHDRSKR